MPLNGSVNLQPCSAVVVDVEGTTSSARFVYDVLFPYAKSRLRDWVREHGDEPETAAALAAVAAGEGLEPQDTTAIVSQLEQWIDEDVKAASLKTLQGLIWQEGYASGELHSHFFADVPPALRAWKDAGVRLAVYSSGSVAAQQSLFQHAPVGDLDALIDANFDITTAGPKRERESYERIAETLAIEPARLLFLSDIEAELAAARAAGWQAVGLRRAGEAQADAGHPSVSSFAELDLTVA
jgi:enolase-phosphatase E1